MNKAAAEIIAGLIPRKMARNRWRGILRYGVIKALKLKRRLKHDHTQPQIRLAVCAIAKNEGPYFKEWLDWHIGQGVEKFYIYDNESTDCTREVLAPYIESGIVEYIYYPGYRRQIAAYDDCIDRHRFDTRWLAFIDLDEFIGSGDGKLQTSLTPFASAEPPCEKHREPTPGVHHDRLPRSRPHRRHGRRLARRSDHAQLP